jgi:N-acetyl-1-D-myo-inositol-2-amino-2-deoxy-alpha-D-glucopyranoside deacetylase
VDKVPPEAAAWNVARLIREVRPAVVVTHGPEGGYGHPDHVAVSGFVTRAWAWAGDPGVEPELTAFAPAKLYYTALPRSFIEKIPGFRDRRADIRGEKLPFLGVADEKITARVDVRKWLRAKMEALACHRSQFEFEPETGQPKTFAAALPAGERLKFFGEERFVLARSTVQRNEAEDDLFAGLRA